MKPPPAPRPRLCPICLEPLSLNPKARYCSVRCRMRNARLTPERRALLDDFVHRAIAR